MVIYWQNGSSPKVRDWYGVMDYCAAVEQMDYKWRGCKAKYQKIWRQ